MNNPQSQAYDSALAEAAQAFMKVMALRGYAVRDYPQNFSAQVAQHARQRFAASPLGAHPQAERIVRQMLQPQLLSAPTPTPAASPAAPRSRSKSLGFGLLRRGVA